MLINEVANRTGLSRDTIRYYEKVGLIKVKRTDSSWNNYKDYSEENLQTLLAVKKAKGFGFTLAEIKEILSFLSSENQEVCNSLIDKTQQKVKEIDRKIRELELMKSTIIKKVNEAQTLCFSTNAEGCSVVSEEFRI